ncbi:MAG: hypothetical protein HW421_3306 [Ignavibacteria bacterium]|nr:hypothetical protein [Ignavibacteria bacterium]
MLNFFSNFQNNSNKLLRITVILVFLFSLVITIKANETGKTGRTSVSSEGCGGDGCHAATSNAATQLSVVCNTGMFAVTPGGVLNFTLTISNPGKVKAGTGIAVKTTETGTTNAGTLAVLSSGVKAVNGEIIHTSPITMTGGAVSIQFSWTAPTTPGTYYLRAVGNAVNGNGKEDINDIWNWMPVKQITVSTTGVDDNSAILPSIETTPNPSNGIFRFNISGLRNPSTFATISDMTGRILRNFSNYNIHDGKLELVWDGCDDIGLQASNGTYLLAIHNGNNVKIQKVVLSR